MTSRYINPARRNAPHLTSQLSQHVGDPRGLLVPAVQRSHHTGIPGGMSCAAFTGGVMMRLVQGVGRKWMSTGAMVVGAGLAVGVAPSTASAMRPLAGGMTRT